MDNLRVGVVGMGKMGLLHAAILNSLPNIKLHAVTDTEQIVTSFIKKNVTDIQVFYDYKEMIDKCDLDLVYITTPVASHIPISTYCIDKKLHFFVEKPLGKNSDECFELCKKIKDINITTMVGFHLRYADTFRKAKEILDSNELGNPIRIHSSVYQTQLLAHSTGWRFRKDVSGGGVLIDLGSHLIDILLWFFGDVKSVQGTTESNITNQVDDTVKGIIKFQNSLESTFEASWNVKNYRLQETTVEIESTNGRMKVNEDYVKIEFNEHCHPKNEDVIYYRQELSKGVPIDIGGSEYTLEDMDFVEHVRRKSQPPTNIIESTKVQSIIDSIYKSAETKTLQMVRI